MCCRVAELSADQRLLFLPSKTKRHRAHKSNKRIVRGLNHLVWKKGVTAK